MFKIVATKQYPKENNKNSPQKRAASGLFEKLSDHGLLFAY